MRLLQQGRADLPAGCDVTYELETIAILQSLLRTRVADDAILVFYEDFHHRHGVRPTAVEPTMPGTIPVAAPGTRIMDAVSRSHG